MEYVGDFQFSNGLDRWLWNGNGESTFLDKDLKHMIVDGNSGNGNMFTWINLIPLEINCCLADAEK